MASFVAPTDPNYQVVVGGGRTVYLYGSRNATWVNNGLWYVLQGNDSLSNQQLVQLATSF